MIFPSRLLLCIGLAVTGYAAAADEVLGPRFFTDVDGRTMSAMVTGLGAQDVRVRRTDDGREFSVPLARLSVLDRRYLEENRERILARFAVLPETDFTRALRKDFLLPDERGGLGVVPAEAWAKTKWFVVVAGVPEDATLSRAIGQNWGKWAASDEEIAVLWVGPAARGAEPAPEFERKLARELPASVAILGGAALREAFAKERAELKALAEAQAPGRAELFFATWHERTPGERQAWKRRVLARQAPYWPTWVDANLASVANGTEEVLVYICDREGKPVGAEALAARKPPGQVAAFPARDALAEKKGNEAAGWVEFAEAPVHAFRVRNGTWPAQVLAMTAETVLVRPQGAKTERLLGLASLAAEDRAALAKLRGEGRQVRPAAEAMVAREVSGAELAKAGRFAVNVLLKRDGSNPQVLRWPARPRLALHADDSRAETVARRIYEEFCTAAGLTEEAGEGREIVFCLGPRDFVERKRRELNPDLEPVSGRRWRYWWNDERAFTKVVVYLVVDWPRPDGERLVLECMSDAFGLIGDSKEFSESAFFADSKARQLAEVDRRLLRVLYRHVPPAAGREAVLRAVNERWANPDAAVLR